MAPQQLAGGGVHRLQRPAERFTLLVTAMGLLGIVLGAALLPALRAARIAPATALSDGMTPVTRSPIPEGGRFLPVKQIHTTVTVAFSLRR